MCTGLTLRHEQAIKYDKLHSLAALAQVTGKASLMTIFSCYTGGNNIRMFTFDISPTAMLLLPMNYFSLSPFRSFE